jgi:hypothetical protein
MRELDQAFVRSCNVEATAAPGRGDPHVPSSNEYINASWAQGRDAVALSCLSEQEMRQLWETHDVEEAVGVLHSPASVALNPGSTLF